MQQNIQNSATVKFEINVADYLPNSMEQLYLVGNDKKFGSWNPENGVAIKRTVKSPVYKASRKLPVGTNLELKIVKSPDWNHVQLGAFCEEVANLKVTVTEDMTFKATVYNWKEN